MPHDIYRKDKWESWRMEKRIEESLWKKSVEIASRSVLETDIETDVAVIGGGLTGILTAYFLEQAGRTCIVLEADRIGSGQTANTTAKALRQEYRAASELGLPAELKENSELPFPVEAVLQFTDQASFHPLKFLKQMAEKVCVFEQTKVMRAEPHLLVTNRGRVCAKQIVFACHYPFVLRPSYYFLRMHQERSLMNI